MKIRTGFVSNSSSSSFIIDKKFVYDEKAQEWKEFTMQDFLEDVKTECRKYRKNRLKYAKRDVKRWLKNPTKEQIQKHRDYLRERYSDSNIDECIKIGTLDEVKDFLDLDFWYSGSAQQFGLYVVYDTDDNFLPEKVLRKLFKKYDIRDDKYCTHMG